MRKSETVRPHRATGKPRGRPKGSKGKRPMVMMVQVPAFSDYGPALAVALRQATSNGAAWLQRV